MKPAAAPESDSLAGVKLDGQLIDKPRAALYGILGHLYNHELTRGFAEELHRAGFFEMLASVEPGFRVEQNLQVLDFGSLEVEFARLFVGPGPQAPPYASVYRKDDQRPGQLWGSTTGEVKRFMAHYGLELTTPGTIPDHISVLFEFMEKLLQAKIDAFARSDDKACLVAERIQRRFFLDYIDPWIERFLLRVEKADPLQFYAAVAKCTSQFMAREKMSA